MEGRGIHVLAVGGVRSEISGEKPLGMLTEREKEFFYGTEKDLSIFLPFSSFSSFSLFHSF